MHSDAPSSEPVQMAATATVSQVADERLRRPPVARAADPLSLPGTFVGLRDVGRKAPPGAAPHFLGALLIASTAGLIGCVAALLLDASLLQSLSIYSLTGSIVFAFLLTVQGQDGGRGR